VRLLAIKHRPIEKGLILVASSTQQFAPLYEDLDSVSKATLDRGGLGPTTWLIPDPKDRIPFWLKGLHNSIAIRISTHPVVIDLCQSFGSMIVSTSANEAGKQEIRSRLKLKKTLGDKLDYIVPGQLGSEANPSTIIDIVSGKTLRQ
jgi:L-threonylcarbamoyladenylate synthase